MAQFPSSGSTLAAFGLTTSAIKSIAIPNDLQAWPTSALSGCTALERITAFGEEVDTGLFALTAQHFTDCTNLKHIQPPSTVDTWMAGTSVFPNVQSLVFPKNVRLISGFNGRAVLTFADFSGCTKLVEISRYSFSGCAKLSSINLANCPALLLLEEAAFYTCPQLTSVDLSGCTQITTLKTHALGSATANGSHLTTVILPPSVVSIYWYALSLFGGANDVLPNLRTIIWKGRSSRPDMIRGGIPAAGVSTQVFGDPKTLEELVADGTIQEIFIP